MPFESGQTIGHYRIDQKVGEGGMGVVYVAEDTRLGRRVALKVLHAEVSAEPARRARFDREARAIAALNHPNIVTIHSVEEAEGIVFLTMELVVGQSLTHMMTSQGLPLGKMLDLSLGIADALVAAHRQGIVHRDLKPDNIMVTSEGRIKVLDFGLAKLRESALEGMNTLPTTSLTEEGKIVGTVSYMSPEQAEGKSLDHRSDIFSFGVVLYEMATGRKPFQGDTAISTISSILKDTPTPPQQVNNSLPPELGRIIKRCLVKEPERRYQSTDDLRNELREIKEESDSGEYAAAKSGVATYTGAVSLSSSPAVSSASLPAPGRSGWNRAAIAVAAILVGTIAVGGGWYLSQRKASPGPASALENAFQMSRATTDGKVDEAAISPDGRYLAYIRHERETNSLRLRQVITGEEVSVVGATESYLINPTFSADGNFLQYVSIDPGNIVGSASRVSVLGGAPRRVLDGVSSVNPSPDGLQLAVVVSTVDQSALRVTGPNGENPRDLLIRGGKDHFDSYPSWSSDSKALVIVSHSFGKPQQIVRVNVEAGQELPIPTPTFKSFTDATWIPGEDALIVAGSDRPVLQGAAKQLWRVALSGTLDPITHDINEYSQISMTADALTVAAVQLEFQSGIEVAEVRGGIPGAFTEVLPMNAARMGDAGISWLDGRRLAHSGRQGEERQIFVTDTVSRSTRVLTSGPSHLLPSVSRDGRTMVVGRVDGDQNHIYRLDPETGREEQFTNGEFDSSPVVSPDGQWVVYSTAVDVRKLMKVPITGGTPIALSDTSMFPGSISPDGREILAYTVSASGTGHGVLIPLAGGPPKDVQGVPPAVQMARFSPDGQSITYLLSHEGSSELWNLPLRGGPAKLLTRLEGKEISIFEWSPDGTRLAVVKTSRSGDVVLLKRAKPVL